MDRKSGVLMHISSLYGDYSIGSFGNNAKEFIDFLKECGFTYWQVLPFLMADSFNSPYQSYSAFSGNPYFIDLDILYNKGKYIESFTIYDEKLNYVAEWLKQLFAESHGKDGKGILPISNVNTRDLHSLGQYLQEGKSIIFETVIGVKNNMSLYIDKYNKD